MKPNILTPQFIEANSTAVPETGCWLWNGYIRKDGYGHLRSFNKKILAHRASWVAFKGSLDTSYLVRHKCDTRCCVNPLHLELGTHQDNADDMVSRGRAAVGLNNARTKLSDEDIVAIRASSDKYRLIAETYGMALATIKRIKSGKTRPVRVIPQLSRVVSV